MMKSRLILLTLLIVSHFNSYSQIANGNWIKEKAVYIDGAELEDRSTLKYNYLRYSFNKSKIQISHSYSNKGFTFSFSIKDKVMQIKNEANFIINEFLIEEVSDSSIVLLQKGGGGFTEDDCIRIYFIPESQYQAGYLPGPDEIFSVIGKDTTYFANSRLYPVYNGSKDYFDVLKEGVPKQPSANLHFYATYVIKKNGEADSLKIIESFDDTFDQRIIKNFNKTKKNWQPASLNGHPVNVQMSQEYTYFTNAIAIPLYEFGNKGKAALQRKEYSTALYYFDLGLQKMPSDIELLYNRAISKHGLGNTEGACKDLNVIKLLNSETANELLLKWCK